MLMLRVTSEYHVLLRIASGQLAQDKFSAIPVCRWTKATIAGGVPSEVWRIQYDNSLFDTSLAAHA